MQQRAAEAGQYSYRWALYLREMEDQAEQALLLYLAAAFCLIIGGAVIIALKDWYMVRLLGGFTVLLGLAALVKYNECLQWAFEQGLFAYLP